MFLEILQQSNVCLNAPVHPQRKMLHHLLTKGYELHRLRPFPQLNGELLILLLKTVASEFFSESCASELCILVHCYV